MGTEEGVATEGSDTACPEDADQLDDDPVEGGSDEDDVIEGLCDEVTGSHHEVQTIKSPSLASDLEMSPSLAEEGVLTARPNHVACEPDIDTIGRDGSRSSEESDDSEREGSLLGGCASVFSAASGTSSYLYGDKGQSEVRHLVHRSLQKKQKEQARRTHPKKETKRVAAGSQKRDKKVHKMKIKESLEAGFF